MRKAAERAMKFMKGMDKFASAIFLLRVSYLLEAALEMGVLGMRVGMKILHCREVLGNNRNSQNNQSCDEHIYF